MATPLRRFIYQALAVAAVEATIVAAVVETVAVMIIVDVVAAAEAEAGQQ